MTKVQNKIELVSAPSAIQSFIKVLLLQKPGLKAGTSIPHIEAHLPQISIKQSHLNQYQTTCGFEQGTYVPITYPHVLASPIQMSLLTSQQFPMKLLGLVHIRNMIMQHEPISSDTDLDIVCSVEGHRETDKGLEFELLTHCHKNHKLVWEEVSTFLSRRKSSSSNKPIVSNEEQDKFEYQTWQVPSDIGRRYACVSGDYNFIHLHALSAKLFGFKQAIAHGMWSLAKCASVMQSEIEALQKNGPVCLDVAFKLPLFLPTKVIFAKTGTEKEQIFKLLDNQAEKPHLVGSLSHEKPFT